MAEPLPAAILKKSEPDQSVITVETIALGMNAGKDDRLFLDYGRFRAKMYHDIHEIVAEPTTDSDGTDFDEYDEFSAHVAAIERTSSEGVTVTNVVGSLRVILDLEEDHSYVAAGVAPRLGQLPIETHFPELGETVDLREGPRCEISRYLAYSSSMRKQRLISTALREAGTRHFINAGARVAYAVLEVPLESRLSRDGLTVTRLTGPRYLEAYASENFGVEMGLRKFAEDCGFDKPAGDPLNVRVSV